VSVTVSIMHKVGVVQRRMWIINTIFTVNSYGHNILYDTSVKIYWIPLPKTMATETAVIYHKCFIQHAFVPIGLSQFFL